MTVTRASDDIQRFKGLSTDTKPDLGSEFIGLGIFVETDTGDVYEFPLGTVVIMESAGSWDVIMTNENGPHTWRHIGA